VAEAVIQQVLCFK